MERKPEEECHLRMVMYSGSALESRDRWSRSRVPPDALPIPPKAGVQVGARVQAGSQRPRPESYSPLAGPFWDPSSFYELSLLLPPISFYAAPKHHH